MNTFELAKKYLTSQRYQVLEENCTDEHIVFRYQMNTFHFWGNPNDEHFFVILLPNFAEVTKENIGQVKENCHQINKDARMVKLYVLDDVILAAAEIFYLAEEDFIFQIRNALKHLKMAKVMYNKLNE